ncbi:MAG TPA: hypothetical protein VF069_03725 [Streptosporangiaceae bacterium]
MPFSLVKGSGSLELAATEPGIDTGQSAPSSSTPAAAAAVGVFATTVIAPATVSAIIESTMSAERIIERPELMITKTLLPVGDEEATAIDDHFSLRVGVVVGGAAPADGGTADGDAFALGAHGDRCHATERHGGFPKLSEIWRNGV